MSKSTGNVVNPFFAIDRFGADVMRYYLAREGGIKDDASYDNVHIIRRYNRDLKDQLGNLTSRLVRSKKWGIRATVQAMKSAHEDDIKRPKSAHLAQCDMLLKQYGMVEKHMTHSHIPAALNAIIKIIYEVGQWYTSSALSNANVPQTNVYFTHQEPWNLAKNSETDEMNKVVYLCAEALRITGILLQPYMPKKAATLLDMLGIREERRTATYAVLGTDFDYGDSKVELGKGELGTLFPPQTSWD